MSPLHPGYVMTVWAITLLQHAASATSIDNVNIAVSSEVCPTGRLGDRAPQSQNRSSTEVSVVKNPSLEV